MDRDRPEKAILIVRSEEYTQKMNRESLLKLMILNQKFSLRKEEGFYKIFFFLQVMRLKNIKKYMFNTDFYKCW